MATKPVDVTLRGKDDTKGATDSAIRRMALVEIEARKMNDAMDAAASKSKSSWMDLSKPLDLLKGAIAGVGIAMLGDFFRSSVQSAADADAAWGRAASALTNAGISANIARPEIDAMAASIQNSTRFADEQATSSFATLLNISGDYAGSLKNVQVAADLAAAKQIDLDTASQLVGKAMIGQTGTLARYGIIVKHGSDAVQEMRERFQGFAERDAGTLQGQLAQVANAWDNVKEAVGRGVAGMADASGETNHLADNLNKLGQWLDDHAGSVRDFGAGLGTIVGWLGAFAKWSIAEPVAKWFQGYDELFELAAKIKRKITGEAEAPDDVGDVSYLKALGREQARERRQLAEEAARNKAKAAAEAQKRAQDEATKAHQKYLEQLQKEVGELAKAKELGTLRLADLKRLLELEEQLATATTHGSLVDRSAAASALASLEKGNPLAGVPGIQQTATDVAGARLRDPTAVLMGDQKRTMAHITSADLKPMVPPDIATAAPALGDDLAESFKKATAAIQGSSAAVHSLGHDIGDVAGGAIANFAAEWSQSAALIGQGAEDVGNAIIKSTRRAIGAGVAAKGSETMLDASKAFAEGFSNPAKFLQAAKLFAVGTGYMALAGALGGGGGSSGSVGGGGGGGGLSSSGFQQSAQATQDLGHVTVYMKGKKTVIDHEDPDEQDAFIDMLKKIAGNRQIDFVYDPS